MHWHQKLEGLTLGLTRILHIKHYCVIYYDRQNTLFDMSKSILTTAFFPELHHFFQQEIITHGVTSSSFTILSTILSQSGDKYILIGFILSR